MKTESNVCPEAVAVNGLPGGRAEIVLSENVETVPAADDGETRYVYDQYILDAVWRADLAEAIAARLDDWLAIARAAEWADDGASRTEAERLEAVERHVKQLADRDITELREQNAQLADGLEITGAAVEAVIGLLMGGVDNGAV